MTIEMQIAKVLAAVAAKYVKEWATKDARVRGKWEGRLMVDLPADIGAIIEAGYSPRDECRFIVNCEDDPLRFVHESGYEYKMDTPLVSDGGSTPKIARGLCKSWADLEPFGKFKHAFYFHDAAYRDAGCWARLPKMVAEHYGIAMDGDKSVWTWMPLTRGMADTLLFQMMPSSDGHNGEVNAIFRALCLGGGSAWTAHRLRSKK